MEITKRIYAKTRKEWRAWLEKNHDKDKEIWLLYPKKHTGKKRIPYGDAVEEALCFGWIDSTAKKVDENFYAQRFTPRKSKIWSEPNIFRMKKMIKLGLANKVGIDVFKSAGAHKQRKLIIPSDIMIALKKDSVVWNNFKKFPESYKKIRIAYIGRRSDNKEEFRKRLDNFLKKTKQNRRFAFGGVIE